MKHYYSLNPLLCAALGAALAYYAFSPLIRFPYAAHAAAAAIIALAAACSLTIVMASVSGNGYRQRRLALFTAFFAGGFALGLVSYCAALRVNTVRPGLPEDEITAISGVLLDDPRVSASGRNITTLKLTGAAGQRGVKTSATGRVLVFFPDEAMPRVKEFGRGSSMYIEGKFTASRDGSASKMFRAVSAHVVKPPAPIDGLRTKIRLAAVALFSETKWGSLALALLIGIRDNLENDFTQNYFKSGCSYILALSGMHLAIISSIIAFLLRKPLGLKAAAAAGAVFTIIYIYLVGPQSSLVRSGIAYLIGAAAILTSLRTNALQILGLSFLLQLLIDPASGGTISFMLSYLALAGMLLAGQPFDLMLRGRLPAIIAQPVAMSAGAFIATMSICAVFFGDPRPIGIVASLPVIPLTTVFMIGAIIYLAVHAVLPPLTVPLGWGLSLVYTALEKITGAAALAPALPVFNPRIFVILSSALPLLAIYWCAVRVKARTQLERFD